MDHEGLTPHRHARPSCEELARADAHACGSRQTMSESDEGDHVEIESEDD